RGDACQLPGAPVLSPPQHKGFGHRVLPRCSTIVRIVLLGLPFFGGCTRQRAAAPDRSPSAAPALSGPADSLMPSGPLGAAIQRARALLVATRDSLPRHLRHGVRSPGRP